MLPVSHIDVLRVRSGTAVKRASIVVDRVLVPTRLLSSLGQISP